VNRSGICGTKHSALAATYETEIVHPVVSVGHRVVNRTPIGALQSEIRPEGCTQKTHSANREVMSIENVNPEALPLYEQLFHQIPHMTSVELVIPGYIHNGA
jgi:hypothetical protein